MPVHRAIQNILKPVFDKLKEGDVDSACSLAAKVLEGNLNDEYVKCTYNAIIFWKEKLSISVTRSTHFDRGEYLFSQWSGFLQFMKRYDEKCDAVVYALKVCVFNIIVDFYSLSLKKNKVESRTNVFRKLGLCYKILGKYEKAIEFLKYASSLDSSSSCILAELADSYAMCGDERMAKVYFREAFFKDALSVEKEFLESQAIRGLIEMLDDKGFTDKEALAWLPIYAVLGGLFSVTRQLKAVELGKIKQEIFLLETSVKENKNRNVRFEVPKLINSYFWLIDHYSRDDINKAKVDEILLRIKLLNPDVYNNYVR